MGGYGSGGHNKIKNSVEGSKRIDIREMQKISSLKCSTVHTTTWTCNGRYIGSVNIRYSAGNAYVVIGYTLTDNATGAKEDREEKIYLAYVKVHYGERAYFICPSCNRRVTTLCFNGVFKCRNCQRLNYSSSQESGNILNRLADKIYKIEKKLKANKDLGCYRVPKPRYMHHKTYRKLRNRLIALSELHESTFDRIATRYGLY